MVRGFLLNNELTDFSFRIQKDGFPIANRLEPGKRPRSSMSPTIVMENGKPYMAIGSVAVASLVMSRNPSSLILSGVWIFSRR
jgi:gamma-glutamyltranspeptidase